MVAGAAAHRLGEGRAVGRSRAGATICLRCAGAADDPRRAGGDECAGLTASDPAQPFDQDDEIRVELAGGRVRATRPVLKSGMALGAVAGHPDRDGRARDSELGGHMGDPDVVVQVAFDHAEAAGRGQWCISVGHARAALLRMGCVGNSILW